MPLIVAVSIVVGLLLGKLVEKQSSSQMPFKVFTQQDKISSILNFVEKNYVDSVNRDDISEGLIPEILKNLDPHSYYLPPRDLAAANETLRGNFDGIGVQFNMVEDTILVIQAVKGGPSEKVGIQAGDRIIAVNEKPVAGVNMPEDSIVSMLRGPRGSKVDVGIYRKTDLAELDFTITRGKIPLFSVDVSYMVTDQIGYLKISTFSQSTFPEFEAHLTKLKEAGCTKLIIDLRDNGGGIMDPATRIADEFLPDKTLIVYTEGHSRPREDVLATKSEQAKDLEVAVLINEGSASASEIVAGAIQDNDRGIIIGRRSFGKGLVQEQATLSDGSAIRLTTARYYSPTGRCIQKSYENGHRDYYMDIYHRFQSGEFMEKDSIDFPDSLKFETPGGRIVFGGGGIMPDYFIPYDTVGITPYLREISNKRLIYNFALKYADYHRAELQELSNWEAIDEYLTNQDVVNSFLSYASDHGVQDHADQIDRSREVMTSQLHAYIARNTIDNEGFYPIIHRIDNTMQETLSLLK